MTHGRGASYPPPAALSGREPSLINSQSAPLRTVACGPIAGLPSSPATHGTFRCLPDPRYLGTEAARHRRVQGGGGAVGGLLVYNRVLSPDRVHAPGVAIPRGVVRFKRAPANLTCGGRAQVNVLVFN